MEINKEYELTFKNGQVTTVKLVKIESYCVGGDHYLFQYLEGETRKHITPNPNTDEGGKNQFYFPGVLMNCLSYKDI